MQCGQRTAAIGISVAQKGQALVVGAAGAASSSLLQTVDRLDHAKHRQRHDQETDHRIQEQADIHRHRAGSLRIRQGGVRPGRFRASLEQNEDIAEIHIPQQQSQWAA